MSGRPTRADDVIFFPAGEDLCLHHIETGEYYLLNSVAEEIWNRCNGELTVDEIAAQIAVEYDVPPDEVNQDAGQLVAYLEAEECLV